MPPQVAPLPVSTPKSNSVLYILIGIIVLIVAAGGYLYYMSFQQVQELKARLSEANGNLASSTAQVVQLQQQVAEATCKGTWSNNTCVPLSVTISANPNVGRSPLTVTFTVMVPDMNYSIDFGDGSTSWLSQGPNAQSQGDCVQDVSGLCTVTVTHTYKSTNPQVQFTAKLMQNGTAITSTIVNIIEG